MTRELSPTERANLVKRLTGGWGNLAKDAVNGVFDFGDFVESDAPRTPFGNAIRTTNRWACRVWSRSLKDSFPESANAFNQSICGGYLESISELPTDGSLDSPFSGGQCAGVNYTVTARVTAISPYEPLTVENTITVTREGPITGVEGQSLATQSICTPPGGASNSGRTNVRAIRQRLIVRSGTLLTISPEVGSVDGWGPATCILTADVVFPADVTTTEVLSIVRTDGLPDNCGNFPPTYTPPGIPGGLLPLAPTVSVDIPGVGPVDVSVSFDDDGNPVVCIPALDICATVDLPTGDNADGLGPGDIGEPATPVDTGAGGVAEGEAPPGMVIGALKINILSSPGNAKQFAPGVFRGAAYIYLGTSDGLDQDFAGSMLTDGQLILPEKDNLTKWKVFSNFGYNLRVTPFYIEA